MVYIYYVEDPCQVRHFVSVSKLDFCRFCIPTGGRTAIDETPRDGVSDRVSSVGSGLPGGSGRRGQTVEQDLP
jgi:hypothetical protein